MKPTRPLPLLFAFVCAVLVATLSQCQRGHAAVPANRTAPVVASQGPAPAAATDRIRILVSGQLQGRLEPCGCASGQLGGLARRRQHIAEQRNYDLLLEGGDLLEGNSLLDVEKLMTAATVLFNMERPYDAFGVGGNDLLMPREEWSAFLTGAPVVTSNLTCAEPGWPGQPFVAKDVRGTPVRIASLLLALPPSLRGEDSKVKLLPPVDGWRRALEGAGPQTRRIAMVHGDEQDIRALIPQLQPSPDLVIGVDPGYHEPAATATPVGTVPLVWSGTRGRVLLDVWLSRENGAPRAICELVPLAGSKTVPGGGGDPAVKDTLLQHRHQVKELGILGQLARQRPTSNGAAYVGNTACAVCHPTAMAAWQQTTHAHAWQTLVKAEADPKRYGWPVTAYPDCVNCHVVGYRDQTGFVDAETTPQLADVGCERCHGAGSDHVASNGTAKLGLIGGVTGSMLCTQCHDYEQSPNFLYGEQWPKIAHGREPK
jgi:Cytochrome c554 and c-prime